MRKHFIFIGLLLSTLLISMDTTILNTTGPIVVEEIGGLSYYAWIFSVYTLLSTITVPIFGKLTDRYGRKRIFLISLSFFLLASLLCGIATSMPELIFYRALKGIGAGGVLPTTLIIIGDLFDVEKRGKYYGHSSLIWGVSALSGPIIGSLIVEFMDWRWIFFINIPVGIMAFLFVLTYQETKQFKPVRIAWVSAIWFTASTLSFLSITMNWKWSILFVTLGLLFGYLFYRKEKHTTTPFLPINILKNKNLLFFNLNTFVFFFAIFGLESFIPLFLQTEQQVSVLMSGIILSGISIGWLFSSYPAGKLIKRFGYKKPILVGDAIIVLSCLPFLFYTNETPIYLTFVILFIHGVCFGLIQTTASIGAYELSKDDEKGFSSSLQSFSRNIGTALSLGYMGTLVLIDSFYILYAALGLSLFGIILMTLIYRKQKSNTQLSPH